VWPRAVKGKSRLPGNVGGRRKESHIMYIGIGAIVLILLIVLILMFLRRA
jgi:hypothetical protein